MTNLFGKYSMQHSWCVQFFFTGAGGPQVPPLDPVDTKVEELLEEKNESIEGIVTRDNDILFEDAS